jgi:hypothetical protein
MYDTSIADRLRGDGLQTVECDGWQWRGSESFDPGGFVFHHTADGPNGRTPSLQGCINGFHGSAPGPLCNVLQSREPDGNDVFYVIAAGRANHAGSGGWGPLTGNSRVHGLEIEHTGVEHFPEHRAILATRCAAALGRGRYDASMCCQHFEWSNWGDGSKIDVAQDVDANHWRDLVRQALDGGGMEPSAPTINREVVDKMWVAYLAYMNWVDVYYNGVQVESFANDGPTNVFGIGPRLNHLMAQGITVTTIADKESYEGRNRIRDLVTAPSRYALQELP